MMAKSLAQSVLRSLPPRVYETTTICPLCGTAVPANGLRARAGSDPGRQAWELVFACPACGLLTRFDVAGLSLEQIQSFQGSAWAAKLRHFERGITSERLRYRRQATSRHFHGVFIVAFLTWMLLIGNFNPSEVLWGLVASLLVAWLTYRFLLFDFLWWMDDPRRWLALGKLLIEFTRQLIVQNVTLAIRVFRPSLPIRPGIVAVATELRQDAELTILGGLMSLTPDTVTMDVDQERGIIYVHWIDVKTTEPEEVRRLISASLEEKVVEWLHER
jgi:multicomponent Na+:H+ antiporter subunit E